LAVFGRGFDVKPFFTSVDILRACALVMVAGQAVATRQ